MFARFRSLAAGSIISIASITALAVAAESPLPESWDYAPAMQKVAAGFHGRPGVVLHVGDSITYANPYGQWARAGQGHTEVDKAALNWMHTGRDDDSDGWWLCRFDHPEGGRSYTAAGGLRLDELLAGGKGLDPLDALVARYRPQMLLLMIGTNDVSQGRSVADYRTDLERAVQTVLDRGVVLIMSTIPPHHARPQQAQQFNEAIRQISRRHSLPLIDYEREILRRRANDWNGTLLNKDDVHPTAGGEKVNAASAPTDENLRSCGYLLRGWLSVRKIAEVKRRVIDAGGSGAAVVNSLASERNASRDGSALAPAKPAGARELRLPVTRDTWFSNVGSEADGNNGGSGQLKVKSIQEMTLVDFDPQPLVGRVVRSATLHVHLSGPERLQRVTVSSFAAPWVEGTGSSYEPQPGSSTHNHRQHPDVPWSDQGGDLCDVILGGSGTLWRMADTDPPDAEGWQHVAVDPRVVSARVAGVSYGCLVFDDTGSEWTRDGEKFSLRQFPNRFFHSRDSGQQRAPYFTVVLDDTDTAAPPPPARLDATAASLPAGEALITWLTPADEGPTGTIGFAVEVDGHEIPRYLIPAAARPGEKVVMHLRDLDLPPGKRVKLAVRALDGAGNRGRPAELTFKVSAMRPVDLPKLADVKISPVGKLPRLGRTDVAIIDALDKVDPQTGEMIPPQPKEYLSSNHLWNAQPGEIRLHAAKNEFVDFQVLIRGDAPSIDAQLVFEGKPGIEASVGRLRNVASERGPLPDPVTPIKAPVSQSEKSAAYLSLFIELYVPATAAAGEHRGTLRLRSERDTLELPITLTVWDFTLPDHLSFIPEMNCYGLPDNELDFYRLAHQHRTVLNRVPYYQNGNIAEGCAPAWDGHRLDWAAWDRRFGQYFDGSAFADLPRRGVPLECFYLPLHENWPSPIETNYNGSYWADEAFPPSYRQAFVAASRQMTEHFDERGWHDTLFQCFQNGKNNFKENGWSRGSSPWLLDEPANFQDYWALRWFGRAFHEGAAASGGQAKMVFRCDISRPEWQRDSLDGVLDYNVVGGAFRRYRRMVLDRKRAFGQIVVEYGSANGIEESNVQPAAWCIDAWSLGADGVLPWQTVGTAQSWRQADRLSLFYPAQNGAGLPVASIRLKSYRRGQQDVEYLTLWCHTTGQPRWAVGDAVRRVMRLTGRRQGTGSGGEDAGVIHFAELRPADLWSLRIALGAELSKQQPAPERRLITFRPGTDTDSSP